MQGPSIVLTTTPTIYRAIVNVIGYTCACPATTSQHVCCDFAHITCDAAVLI